MAGTFSQIYIQIVFSVGHRQSLIRPSWKDELCKYVSGIIHHKGQKPIIVNGTFDHIHILMGMKPSVCLADIVREIKNNSSKFINDNHLSELPFAW